MNVALPSSTALFGPEQRRSSAEPVIPTDGRVAPDVALVPGPSPALVDGEPRTLALRDQLEAWVNEGGAGDDVAS